METSRTWLSLPTSGQNKSPPGDAVLSPLSTQKLKIQFHAALKSEQLLEEGKTQTSPKPHEAAWLLLEPVSVLLPISARA